MGSSWEGEIAGTEKLIPERNQFIWPQNLQSEVIPFIFPLTSHTCPKEMEFAAPCCFGHWQKQDVSVDAYRYIHYLLSKVPHNPYNLDHLHTKAILTKWRPEHWINNFMNVSHLWYNITYTWSRSLIYGYYFWKWILAVTALYTTLRSFDHAEIRYWIVSCVMYI